MILYAWHIFTLGSPAGTIVSVGSLGRASTMLENLKLVRTPRTALTRWFHALFLSVWLQYSPSRLGLKLVLHIKHENYIINLVFWTHHHHHHHVVPLAWISLTLSRHFYLSFIASGRSSGLHSVSSQSCCIYVRAGRPAFARPYVGVLRRTSLMSSSLLFQI